MRRAAKIDANQNEIVKALRKLGVSVYSIGKPCDLLCGWRGRTTILEVKDGNKPPSARKLTPDQVEFFSAFDGEAYVVETIEEAIHCVGRSGAHRKLKAKDRALKQLEA